MEDNINKIREACIKANPSIKDLVFGCEVRAMVETEPGIVMVLHGMIIGLHEWKGWYEVKTSVVTQKVAKEYIFDIFGRPIRLADVLLAIPKEKYYTVNNQGGRFSSGYGTAEPCNWNLIKDDLTLQSPETISFIAELLSSN